MGAIDCSKHGYQVDSGPLSCEHVLAALEAGGAPVPSATVQVDLLSDGSVIVDYLLRSYSGTELHQTRVGALDLLEGGHVLRADQGRLLTDRWAVWSSLRS